VRLKVPEHLLVLVVRCTSEGCKCCVVSRGNMNDRRMFPEVDNLVNDKIRGRSAAERPAATYIIGIFLNEDNLCTSTEETNVGCTPSKEESKEERKSTQAAFPLQT
jgi:hypothetical protein